jgi:hypothetical protein
VEQRRAPRGVKNEDIIIPSTKNCTVNEASEEVEWIKREKKTLNRGEEAFWRNE